MNDLVLKANRQLRDEQFRELYRIVSDQIGQGLIILPKCLDIAETDNVWYPLWKIAPNRNQAALVIIKDPVIHTEEMKIAWYNFESRVWTTHDERDEVIDADTITHWRPVPDWPKDVMGLE